MAEYRNKSSGLAIPTSRPSARLKSDDKMASSEMNQKQDANLLVGYFSLDGSFSQLVGAGLLMWGSRKNWKAASST